MHKTSAREVGDIRGHMLIKGDVRLHTEEPELN